MTKKYKKPVVDLTAGFAFFDGLFFRTGSFRYLETDSVCPIAAEEQIFVCRQMEESLLNLQKEKGNLSVLDVGTGSGVLGIYAERLLNKDPSIEKQLLVSLLDISPIALEVAKNNAEDNNCDSQSIQYLLEKEGYNIKSVDRESQNVILMNPPFNPTYPDAHGQIPVFGDTKDFCLGCFRSWINIAAQHIHNDGLIIGCQMSPMCGEDVVAVKDLTQYLGSNSSVRYLYINNIPCDTKEFLTEQYSRYLKSIIDTDGELHKRILDWIDEVSLQYQNLNFIYFEASKSGGLGEVKISSEPGNNQYDPDWKRRIFLQSLLLEKVTENKANILLSQIKLANVSSKLNDTEDSVNYTDKLAKDIIYPLSNYLSLKIESYHGINNSKYLNDYLNGFLFCEVVLFCPQDIDTPDELLSFSFISKTNSSSVPTEKQFFHSYYSLLKFLYDKKSSIFFAPDFFRVKHSNKWLPQPNYLSDKFSPEYKSKYLISLSSDAPRENSTHSTLVEEIGRSQNWPEKIHFTELNLRTEETTDSIHFCSNSSFLQEFTNTEKSNGKVEDIFPDFHLALKELGSFKNETFMLTVPIYSKNISEKTHQDKDYTAIGAFLLFGELTPNLKAKDEDESKAKDELWRMLRDLALDLKQDLNPIMSGYAYHRSGAKGFQDSLEDITYELQGFWSLIHEDSKGEMLAHIQDICYLQSTSCEEDNLAIPTERLLSFISGSKNFKDLIDYLVATSVLFTVGKKSEKLSCSKPNDNNEILGLIKNDREKVARQVIFITNMIDSAHIIGRKKFTLSIKIILTALNNTLGKISIDQENQVTTISLENNLIRLVNNYCDSPRKDKYTNHTELRLKRLCKLLGNSSNLIFSKITTDDLRQEEKEFWENHIQGIEGRDKNKFGSLWLTQIPIALEIEKNNT
jgi:SAM-dependent methyltransferase